MGNSLTAEEQKLLLSVAREAITSHLENRPLSRTDDLTGTLLEKRGCFVSIKANGKLRGCIGNFQSDKPLHQLVCEMAISAATKDPRFYPMIKKDLNDFTLEISVLAPLRKVMDIAEIEVGIHGLYMEKNFCRGVLLPQVAGEYGWDRETFLNQTSVKSGMNPGDWKEGADIYIFTADVFKE